MYRISSSPQLPARTLATAFAVAAFALLALAASATAATFEVDTTSDNPGQNACTVAANDCSLRGAILTANTTTAADVINFSGPGTITIDTPLDEVTEELTISTAGQAVILAGSGSYVCTGDDYALDISAASASPSFVNGLAINNVCGRAIRSNVPAPTIQVGPRRSNNTVSISGSAPGSTGVSLFRVLGSAASGESSSFFQPATVAAGGYSFFPAPLPASGDRFAAISNTSQGTSNFSGAATTPADLTSPSLYSAVAVSNDSLRIDFNEGISPASVSPAGFALSVGGIQRTIVGALVNGASVYLYSNTRWNTGEAGTVALTGGVRVTDFTGNEVLSEPSTTMFAGPGEVQPITISNFRFTPQKMCSKKTRKCRRNYTYAYISLNKDARVIFKVYRGTKSKQRELVTFIRRLKAGRNKLKVTSSINGRNLPASTLSLRAVAQDVALTRSAPADALFRLVKHKRDL